MSAGRPSALSWKYVDYDLFFKINITLQFMYFLITNLSNLQFRTYLRFANKI